MEVRNKRGRDNDVVVLSDKEFRFVIVQYLFH